MLLQRNSISPTEREKYRNARSPMSAAGDMHAPDMKKIKREEKDGHVRETRSVPFVGAIFSFVFFLDS